MYTELAAKKVLEIFSLQILCIESFLVQSALLGWFWGLCAAKALSCDVAMVLWHYGPMVLKPRLNDCNMPRQHIATLLGATCCVCLATVLWHVATCWVLSELWPFSNLSQQHPTCHDTSQHGGQMHAICCAQQCCNMLHWHVAIIWPGLKV